MCSCKILCSRSYSLRMRARYQVHHRQPVYVITCSVFTVRAHAIQEQENYTKIILADARSYTIAVTTGGNFLACSRNRFFTLAKSDSGRAPSHLDLGPCSVKIDMHISLCHDWHITLPMFILFITIVIIFVQLLNQVPPIPRSQTATFVAVIITSFLSPGNLNNSL